MNWGKGILLGMAIFVLFITSMGIYMFLSPVDDYDHQYYEKGLNFNQDYNHEKQVAKDHAQPAIQIADGYLKLTFIHAVKGKITFERPSNNLMDKVFQLDSGSGMETDIPVGSMDRGQWRLVVSWKSDNKDYLYQKEIFIK
jgi:hypothetical protein